MLDEKVGHTQSVGIRHDVLVQAGGQAFQALGRQAVGKQAAYDRDDTLRSISCVCLGTQG